MIKNLLFDLGGVIMDIKRERCVEAFRRLGLEEADAMLDPYVQRGVFLRVEDGSLSPDEFRVELRKRIPHPVTDADIDSAFVEFLVGIPIERLRALERLHSRYGIYMLSNTNPIMWHSKIAAEFRKDGHDREYYFDGIVTSFATGVVKPHPEIFHAAERQYGLVPEETLFLDDSPANIEAARALGYQGVVVEPGTEFVDLIP